MSTTLLIAIVYIFFTNINCDRPACSADDATCSIHSTTGHRDINETLGQYLLRKQTVSKKSSTYSSAMSIRMVNPNNKYYDVYWYAGPSRTPSRIYKGPIKPHSLRSTNSYRGHVFYFTERGAKPEDELWRFKVTKGINIYICEPIEDESHPFYLKLKEQKAFYEQYQIDTGRAWIHHYPRPKPFLHIWSVAEGVGHIHKITTAETLWFCIPDDFDSYILYKL